MQATQQPREARIAPEIIRLAVASLISEQRMVRRAGVIGWPVEVWEAAKRLLQELAPPGNVKTDDTD
ncbi:MAG TPA: hypothetical protein VKX49_04345 [Bryobacteraceae bacterium]|nr:hypothetical protein [Bryobacteraceae bacterium]